MLAVNKEFEEERKEGRKAAAADILLRDTIKGERGREGNFIQKPDDIKGRREMLEGE